MSLRVLQLMEELHFIVLAVSQLVEPRNEDFEIYLNHFNVISLKCVPYSSYFLCSSNEVITQRSVEIVLNR
jgi:hypothetical protein